jgi:hypothetical protein
MVWRLFATEMETAETMEGVALNRRAPYFYPTSTQERAYLWGNKLVMASLLRDFKSKIDPIYIDPPFDVGTDFTMNVPIGKDQSTLEMVAYRDMWGKG